MNTELRIDIIWILDFDLIGACTCLKFLLTSRLIMCSGQLTHFMPLVSFYTPWKHKNRGFLMISGGIERDKWHEMCNHMTYANKSHGELVGVSRGSFIRSNHPEVFCKKGARRGFAKLSGKHLCQSLFFKKVAGLYSGASVFLWILWNF